MMRQLIELRSTHPAMTAADYSYLHDISPAGDAPNRIIHLQKQASAAGSLRLRSIELILNCGTEPVSIAHLIDEKTQLYVSLRCEEKMMQPGGFLFFERR